nr:MAG TPA: hypothetical protein [Caudoviricetes sp.]
MSPSSYHSHLLVSAASSFERGLTMLALNPWYSLGIFMPPRYPPAILFPLLFTTGILIEQ